MVNPLTCISDNRNGRLDVIREEFFTIENKHEPISNLADGGEILIAVNACKIRQSSELLAGEIINLGNAVNYQTDKAILPLDNDGAAALIVFYLLGAQLKAGINNGNDAAAQIDYAADKTGYSGDIGAFFIVDYLNNIINADTIDAIVDIECEIFLRNNGGIGNFYILSHCDASLKIIENVVGIKDKTYAAIAHDSASGKAVTLEVIFAKIRRERLNNYLLLAQ